MRQIKLPTRAQVAQGSRVAVAVAGPIALHFTVADKVPESIRVSFTEATLWAAVTVVMSTLTVMGRAAVIYTERSAGTAVGGLVSWALLAACSSRAYLTVMSVALVWVGQVGGEACGRAYAGRLFGVTSMLVLSTSTPLGLTFPLTRMVGILAGVLVSSLTSALLLPVTGSRQAVEQVEAALGALVTLSEATWGPYSAALQQAQLAAGAPPPGAATLEAPVAPAASRGAGVPAPSCALELQLDPEKGPPPALKRGLQQQQEGGQPGPPQQAQDAAELPHELDAATDAAWACFRKVAEALADIPHEVYVGRLPRSRVDCFLPGTPFWPGRRPYVAPAAVKEVLAAMRACVRLLYSMHLALAPGFSPEQLGILCSAQSLDLLQRLPALATAAFAQVLAAYRACLRGGGRGAAAGAGGEDAVAALAAAAAQLQVNSVANREALQRLLARLQEQHDRQQADGHQAGGQQADRQQAPAPERQGSDGEAEEAGLLRMLSTQVSMRARGHDGGGRGRFHSLDVVPGGIPALFRFHSLEYLLEQLALHVRLLQKATADLAAVLPR